MTLQEIAALPDVSEGLENRIKLLGFLNQTEIKEYISSLRTNFSGFELYRSHFHQSGYEKAFVDSVEKKISDIEDMINSYDTLKTQLDNSYENLVLALEEGNVTKSLENYSVFVEKVAVGKWESSVKFGISGYAPHAYLAYIGSSTLPLVKITVLPSSLASAE